MRKRNSPPRTTGGATDRSELEGFLEGVRHRLTARRREGTPLPDLERRLRVVEAAIADGDVPSAERILLTVSDRLDEDESEPELNEFPRGLVAYDAGTDRGVPTPEGEEPVLNRLRIVERLLGVAEAERVEVADLRALLAGARASYDGGDRRAAKETGERILDALDRRRGERPAREP
jgi:hypothetical protein